MEVPPRASYSAPRDTTPEVLPASQYLQERLQQRRARNTRPIRARQSDFGPQRARDDDIFFNEAEESRHAPTRAFDSSPLTGSLRRREDAGDASRKRALGVKGMDEHMDRLTKENFALKLELDHRRDHTAKLQEKIDAMRAQVERAEQLHEEHTELLRINSQLVEELEKRDKAVEEAMDIICDLEERVDDMEERSSITRPSTANADSGYAGTETHEHAPASSPLRPGKGPTTPLVNDPAPPAPASAATNRLLSAVNANTPFRPRREPAILSEKKQSTHALRSVYLETTQSLHPVKSFASLLTRQEERSGNDEAPSSPHLSALSESSFPSMYSPKKGFSPDRHALEAGEDETLPATTGPSHLRQDSIKRVSQWIREGDFPEDTPSKSAPFPSRRSLQPNEALPSTSPQLPVPDGEPQHIRGALSIDPSKANSSSLAMQGGVEYIQPLPIQQTRNTSKTSKPTSFGGAMFGEPLLPPTPESASTHMLRASRSSIAVERGGLDGMSHKTRANNALGPGVRTAPQQMRSSVELNNAYQSSVQHREACGREHHEDDAASDTVRDLSAEYDGFPDGGSIVMGTPSRFLKHGKPPAPIAPDDGYDTSPTLVRQPPFARRQSSSETARSVGKPLFNRAETSPILTHGQVRMSTINAQSPPGRLMSPRSYHSGSSSNRTIVLSDERPRDVSPELYRNGSRSVIAAGSPAHPRTSPSPARRLSKKAQGILRRMSNTQREGASEREKSPLPTLTTAPSSAYVNVIPKEVRRPGTGYSGGEGVSPVTWSTCRAVDANRPPMSLRINTAPNAPGRRLSAGVTERASMDTERKNLFRRSNSAHRGGDAAREQEGSMATPDGNGMRGILTRRRDSIKDAVASAARLPWR